MGIKMCIRIVRCFDNMVMRTIKYLREIQKLFFFIICRISLVYLPLLYLP